MKTDSSNRRIKLDNVVLDVLKRHGARQAAEMLQAGEEYERNDFIFARGPVSDRQGHFIYQEYARRHFKQVLRDADLPADEIRLYDLRHTHISQLILDGVDLKLASQRAGHSSIQQTADTYAHLGDEAEEQMAEVTEGRMQEAVSA